MHVLGIVGSMRQGRNTETLVRQVIADMAAIDRSLSSEIVSTAPLKLSPCQVVCHPSHCAQTLFGCSIKDDVKGILDKMVAADVILIGAPQYFRGPPVQFQALTERLISMAYFRESAEDSQDDESPLAGKPCGLVAVAEYSSPQDVLEYLHDVCLLLKMRPARLDQFPYVGVGGHGDLEIDEVFHPFACAKELAHALLNPTR